MTQPEDFTHWFLGFFLGGGSLSCKTKETKSRLRGKKEDKESKGCEKEQHKKDKH